MKRHKSVKRLQGNVRDLQEAALGSTALLLSVSPSVISFFQDSLCNHSENSLRRTSLSNACASVINVLHTRAESKLNFVGM